MMIPDPLTHRKKSRGFTLVELTLAIALVAIFFSVLAPLVIRVDRQQRALAEEQFALAQISNLLDELTVCAPAELPELLETARRHMHEVLEARLTAPEFSISLQSLEQPTSGTAIHCRLTWVRATGTPSAPLVITGFNFLPVEDET